MTCPSSFRAPLPTLTRSLDPTTLQRRASVFFTARWIALLALAQSIVFTLLATELVKVYMGR